MLAASDLAVVIPTRDRWDTLRRTLRALAEQTAMGFEVIVVVDGQDQEIPSLPRTRVLQQRHAGPGAARNLGVTATERPLIMLLGDDMLPDQDYVARHLEHHRAAPADQVAVVGRIVWHPSVPRDHLHRWLDWSEALFPLPERATEDAGWTRFYSSSVSLKRAFYLDANGFDPDFNTAAYEDLDLGWRLATRGLRLIYDPHAVVRHLHVYDWGKLRRRYETCAAAEHLMVTKHPWFAPWYYDQMIAAQSGPSASRIWARVVDWVPKGFSGLRWAVEKRADRYYKQTLAPGFLAAWAACEAAERTPNS